MTFSNPFPISHQHPSGECVHLHNTGKEPVSMAGCYVGDVKGNHFSAAFGDIAIAAGDTVLLWTAPAYAKGAPGGLVEIETEE